jgi:redox-sensitive bicupin YhaK (pirin superfamily)
LTGVMMATVRLAAGATADLPAPAGRAVLLYVVSGRVRIGDVPVEPWTLVTLHDDGDAVGIEATESAVLLYGHADPIREPVVAHGPFVMNTRDEIAQAVRDYQAGLFNGTGPLEAVSFRS